MSFNVNLPADVAKLRTELTTDPRGYGFAALVTIGNDAEIAVRSNTVRDGTNPPANPTAAGGVVSGKITINRPDVPPAEILGAIDVRDFVANPGVLAGSWFESVTQFGVIPLIGADGKKSLFRDNIDRLVANGNGSQTRLDAAAVRSGSRIEELFGAGSSISADHVAKALRG